MKSTFKHAAGLQSQFFIDLVNEVQEEIGDASDDAIEKFFKSKKSLKETAKLVIAGAKISLSTFFSGNSLVKIYYFGDNFRDWILSQKFEYVSGLSESRKHVLPKAMNDTEIIKEFKIQPYRSVSELLTALHDKLVKQSSRENGELLNNGYANLFYLELNGRVVAVDAHWDSDDRRWRLRADDVGDDRWGVGYDVFSRS